jgi:hypothetical protein
VLGWKKLVFIKYYRKIGDVDIRDPLKHPIQGAMILVERRSICACESYALVGVFYNS